MGDPAPRILIVDDERPNRDLLEAMLAPEGYRLATAVCGEDAIAIVAEDPPDLILLDVMMPRMDGYQTASVIKANPATKAIPIVMVSGADEGDATLPMLRAQADEFLAKPVDRAALYTLVRNLIGPGAPRRPPRATS